MASHQDVLDTVREDDFVEYFIYPKIPRDGVDLKVFLNNCLASLVAVIDKYASNYIWQKDELSFLPRFENGIPSIDESAERLPPHLYGVTHYGDNIEDEWFIVFLLLKATEEIPGIVVRVIDSDGEFLLIEAANHLPNWANPENCEQRVYLYNGSVHLVGENRDQRIRVEQAVTIVRSRPETTVTSTDIQAAINSRISGYPKSIAENHHSCNVFVPVRVAALLKARPSLVAAAVTAFSHRDPLDTKACRAMRYFPPEQCVMTRVVFTKCLYAMLSHQKYIPDRRTGWKLPPTTDSKYAANILGVKLACGFEILVAQAKGGGQTDDMSKDWQLYKQSLISKGYFMELLEGSQEYVRLEDEAKEYFHTHCVHSQPPISQLVLNLLRDLTVDIDDLQNQAANLPPPDDDSWLNVSQEELDQMMEQRYGCKPTHNSTDISTRLAHFLNHVSSVDGAEYPQDGESPPIRPRRGVKPKKDKIQIQTEAPDKDDDDNRVTFDHEAFSCAVQNILDFVVPEDNWDMESEGSGMSSYEDEGDMDLGNRTGEQAETPISELKQYMDQMDRELSTTTLGKSFDKAQPSANKKVMEESFSEVENFEPVNIDMNALKNILESYQAQMGAAGPASNLLGPMGVRLESPQE